MSHTRQYLSLDRVKANELPPHQELPAQPKENSTSLVQFLDTVFAEIFKVDFDADWKSQGKWQPKHKTITMPAAHDEEAIVESSSNIAESAATKTEDVIKVPVLAEQRVKTMRDNTTWLARTSYHVESDVKYAELDELLSQEHSLNEARYTPSVYDANELLAWSSEDLRMAVGELRREFSIQRVQMSSKHAGACSRVSLMVPSLPNVPQNARSGWDLVSCKTECSMFWLSQRIRHIPQTQILELHNHALCNYPSTLTL